MVQRREVVMEWMDGGVWRCWWMEGAVKVEARWSGGTPHAGLSAAAAGGGEGGVRERDEMPGPMGISCR